KPAGRRNRLPHQRHQECTLLCQIELLCQVEFFLMQQRVALHQHRPPKDLFDLLQVRILIGLQHLGDFGVDAQHHFVAFHRAGDLLGFHQDFADHGLHALHVARAFAIWARHAQGALQALLDALAGDGHQSEIVELQNLVGARSARMASSRTCITFWRFLRSSMSMKSTTMMPPKSRRRIWRTISLMASVLVLTMVSSRRLDLPTYLPVLTSMATRASV